MTSLGFLKVPNPKKVIIHRAGTDAYQVLISDLISTLGNPLLELALKYRARVYPHPHSNTEHIKINTINKL